MQWEGGFAILFFTNPILRNILTVYKYGIHHTCLSWLYFHRKSFESKQWSNKTSYDIGRNSDETPKLGIGVFANLTAQLHFSFHGGQIEANSTALWRLIISFARIAPVQNYIKTSIDFTHTSHPPYENYNATSLVLLIYHIPVIFQHSVLL